MTTLTKLPVLATFVLALMFGTFSTAFAAQDETEPIVGTPSITESAALDIAADAYTGSGKFTDIELEMEKGVLVYAVEFTESDGNEVDVKINAKTGSVVLVESDKDEAVDDDLGDEEEDESVSAQTDKLRMLIDLLNQLIVLLRAQAN